MVQRAVHNYYKFFDETLGSTTFIVLFITLLIFMVGTLSSAPYTHADYLKGNIRESQSVETEKNIVIINGVEYELQFIKVQ